MSRVPSPPNYNKDLVVKTCSICNYSPTENYHKELETHHINFQTNCLEDGKIKEKPYLSKNMLYNLVVLCRKCHEEVHRDEITINGYSDTSIGPLLNYTRNSIKYMERMIDCLSLSKTEKSRKKKLLPITTVKF